MSLDLAVSEPSSPPQAPQAPQAADAPGGADLIAARTSASGRTAAFGSFWIGATEFAIHAGVIQEMVSEPEAFASVPLAPPYLLGVFNLRETIIPVVDLRILFGLPPLEETGGRKIAIIENGEHCVGLMFDESSGVINIGGATRVEFHADESGERNVVVEGVLRLDNGARMVQVLDLKALLKGKDLPRVAIRQMQEKADLGQRLNCITFRLGDTQCALNVRAVQEILDIPEVHQSPMTKGHVIGEIELRGRTVPMIDFHGFMGNPPQDLSPAEQASQKLLILKLPEGLIGLVVHSIDSIKPFFEADVLPLSDVRLPRHDVFVGCLMNDDDIIILLDHDELLKTPELVSTARSFEVIYQTEQKKKSESTATEKVEEQASARQSTYILFTIEMQLAIDISSVNEIVDRPKVLAPPPSAIDYVDGIFNLRGDMITLVNPRLLYHLPNPEITGQKVLIFHRDGQKYGMVVDSVDEIVNGGGNRFTDVPTVAQNGMNRIVSEDVTGCLWVASKGPDSAPVMVLDVGRLVERCSEAPA